MQIIAKKVFEKENKVKNFLKPNSFIFAKSKYIALIDELKETANTFNSSSCIKKTQDIAKIVAKSRDLKAIMAAIFCLNLA